jgi:predicted RNA-binding protein with PUA-like domain
MAHWLIKSEPYKYPFEQLEKDGRTLWDGVRNFEARNNLRAMESGDWLLYYHSNEGKAVVGIAKLVGEHRPDPTSDEDWSAVEIAPVQRVTEAVTLAAIKANPKLAAMALLKRSRLSVVPVTPAEFREVLRMGKTKL